MKAARNARKLADEADIPRHGREVVIN
jgi:hypothetical protein